MALGITLVSLINSCLYLKQQIFFARKLAAAELNGPPIFILGHWRSGTTLLHELLVRDERFSSPSTLHCFVPDHFLASDWFLRKFGSWLLPSKRPMDNMATGWERPQEDEFALLVLGMRSPYRRMAFPNQPPVDMNYLDFRDVSEADINAWLESLRSFLLGVSVATEGSLVIKSPTHTGRVGWLAKAFPDAKFIHISRNPRSLFPSTCRMWRSLDDVQSLQRPKHEGLEDYVIECLQRMYASFHEQRKDIDPSRLIDIRYEDLTDQPVETLRSIYERLRLGDFKTVQPVIEDWAKTEHRDYQTNRHSLPPDQDARICEAWRDYFQTYRYE